MTYLQFHLIFILPPMLVLVAWLARDRRVRDGDGRLKWWPLAAIMVIALVYTTPWDNYLVRERIWWYGEDRVIGTIGYVPVEEYLFFALQPLLSGMWLYLLLSRLKPDSDGPTRPVLVLVVGASWMLIALVGIWMLQYAQTRYLALILAWAAPVLAGQWLYNGSLYVRYARTMVLAVAVPTLYLWFADRMAIGAEIWTISPAYTTGLHLLGLPVEEAVFFSLTNLLVVQGLLLFLMPKRLRPGMSELP